MEFWNGVVAVVLWVGVSVVIFAVVLGDEDVDKFVVVEIWVDGVGLVVSAIAVVLFGVSLVAFHLVVGDNGVVTDELMETVEVTIVVEALALGAAVVDEAFPFLFLMLFPTLLSLDDNLGFSMAQSCLLMPFLWFTLFSRVAIKGKLAIRKTVMIFMLK